MPEPRDKNLGPGEIGIPAGALADAGSQEVLRAWIVGGGLHVSLLPAFETPDMWAMLLVDVARHAARSYARESAYTEDEALARIVDMFEAEIARPTDVGTTAPRSQQGH